MVFGQPPRTDCVVLEILEEQGIQDEQDVGYLFVEMEGREANDIHDVPTTSQTTQDVPAATSTDIREEAPTEGVSGNQQASQVKRGKEYQLLDGAKRVATGTEVFGRTTLHGQPVDPHHQSAGADPGFRRGGSYRNLG